MTRIRALRRTNIIAGLRPFAGAALLGISMAGCGPEPPPPARSPTAEEDPARLEEALRVSEEIRTKTQEAERKAMKRFNLPRPPESPGSP